MKEYDTLVESVDNLTTAIGELTEIADMIHDELVELRKITVSKEIEKAGIVMQSGK